MNRVKFRKMWAMGESGSFMGEIIALNFSNLNQVAKRAGLVEKNAVVYYKNEIGTEFYNLTSEMKISSNFGYKKFTDNKKVLTYLKKSKELLKKNDLEYTKFNKIKLNEQNIDRLYSYLNKYVKNFNEIYSYYHACQPQYFTKIENYLITKLQEKNSKNLAIDIYNLLSTPDEMDAMRMEELAWLKIIRQAQQKVGKKYLFTLENIINFPDLKKKIEKHSQQYIFLGSVEAYRPWDFNHYLNLLNQEISQNIDIKISDILRSKKILIKNKINIIKENKIDKNIANIANNMAKLSNNRLFLRFGWSKLNHMYAEVLSQIATAKTVDSKDVLYYKRNEIRDLVFKDTKPSKTEISKRKKSFLFYTKNGVVNFYTDKIAIIKKEEIISEELKKFNELKGSVACKGYAKGKVIVFSWIEKDVVKKMNEMNQGDILVAGQTRPFLIPAIKKASAIITDEGGITCHAAIISRELNIPCIIGTKIATKILKEGDIVEVDANNGIIKIIK